MSTPKQQQQQPQDQQQAAQTPPPKPCYGIVKQVSFFSLDTQLLVRSFPVSSPSARGWPRRRNRHRSSWNRMLALPYGPRVFPTRLRFSSTLRSNLSLCSSRTDSRPSSASETDEPERFGIPSTGDYVGASLAWYPSRECSAVGPNFVSTFWIFMLEQQLETARFWHERVPHVQLICLFA